MLCFHFVQLKYVIFSYDECNHFEIMTPTIDQSLKNLAPKPINYTKCTSATSIYQEILQPPHKKRRLDHQNEQWFNLGNGQTFNDPITAAISS